LDKDSIKKKSFNLNWLDFTESPANIFYSKTVILPINNHLFVNKNLNTYLCTRFEKKHACNQKTGMQIQLKFIEKNHL